MKNCNSCEYLEEDGICDALSENLEEQHEGEIKKIFPQNPETFYCYYWSEK